MKKFYYFTLLLTFAVVIGFTGCKKNAATQPLDESIQSSQDNALVDGEFTSIYSYLDSQGDNTLGSITEKGSSSSIQVLQTKSDLLPDCATFTWDSAARKLTIDFGTTDCTCKDGFTRRGKIIATFTGKYKQVSSSVSVTLQDYYVQDMSVTGTKTITYQGNATVHINVSNASIVTPTGTISWNADRTIQKTAGIGTLTTLDDEYAISESATGKNRQGVSFVVQTDVNHPLIKKVICRKKDFVSGVVTIQNSNGASLSVNFNPTGIEACDKLATVTYNGVTKTIVLR